MGKIGFVAIVILAVFPSFAAFATDARLPPEQEAPKLERHHNEYVFPVNIDENGKQTNLGNVAVNDFAVVISATKKSRSLVATCEFYPDDVNSKNSFETFTVYGGKSVVAQSPTSGILVISIKYWPMSGAKSAWVSTITIPR